MLRAVVSMAEAEGFDARAGTPAEFGAFLATEREKWLGVAEAAHIRID